MSQKDNRLNYQNDIIIIERPHFFGLINANQGRSHLIIRSRRDITPDFSNDLSTFSRPLKDEFWFIVQYMVAKINCPCLLCHHFGDFRSADHFHVHIVVKPADFARYAVRCMGGGGNANEVAQKIESKCQVLIRKHFGYKAKELEEIAKMTPDKFGECETECGDFRLEIHEFFPRISFIPKEPILYETDPKKLIPQLQYLREKVFDAMTSFAKSHKFTAYRTWQKLSGDVFFFNYNRTVDNLIFGVLQPYAPEFYAINPNRTQWLENWKNCEKHPKNYNHFAFEPLSCV